MKLTKKASYISNDTPILTKKGWKLVRNLYRNNIVYDLKGNWTKVIHVENLKTNKLLYKASFKDGGHIDGSCNLELCHLTNRDHTYLNYEKYKINHLKDEAELKMLLHKLPFIAAVDPKIYKHLNNLEKKRFVDLNTLKNRYQYDNYCSLTHYIPCVFPEPYRDKPMKVHPYLLGVWLVNGYRTRVIIRTRKAGILNKLKNLGYEVQHKGPMYFFIPKVHTYFRKYGLFKQKRIPYVYKYGSIKTRFQILEGICDGIAKKGKHRKVITLVDPLIVKDLREVLFSLNIPIKTSSYTPKKNGDIVYRKRYVTTFSLPTYEKYMDLQKVKLSQNVKRWTTVTNCSTEKVTKTMSAIVVSSDTHSFLAGYSLVPVKDNFNNINKKNKNDFCKTNKI